MKQRLSIFLLGILLAWNGYAWAEKMCSNLCPLLNPNSTTTHFCCEFSHRGKACTNPSKSPASKNPCTCNTDQDCSSDFANGPLCLKDGPDHSCGCSTDHHCISAAHSTSNKCVYGACGCIKNADCKKGKQCVNWTCKEGSSEKAQ